MGQLEQIWIKRMKGGPMNPAPRAVLREGRGIAGNANQDGWRQVTIVSVERWRELMEELDADLDPSARRANLLVSGIDLEETRERVLLVGECRLRVRGETRPCHQMEAALPGLREAMGLRWRGGVFTEVLGDGDIAVGDLVRWE